MAIATDGTGVDGGSAVGGVTSLSWSHTVGAGSNRVLYVNVSIIAGGGIDPYSVFTGVTYNGVAMTEVDHSTEGAVGGAPQAVILMRLVNPASGAHNIVVSTSSVFAIVGSSMAYSGVDQVTPEDVHTNGLSASTADFSLGLTSTVDNCWMIFANKNNSGASSAGTNSTLRVSSANGDAIYDSGGVVHPAGALTMHATLSAGWVGAAAMIAPAGGGGGGGVTVPQLERLTRGVGRGMPGRVLAPISIAARLERQYQARLAQAARDCFRKAA